MSAAMPATAHWLGLSGRVCAVTGAASGIGAAIAQALAEAGASVALLDRDGPGVQAGPGQPRRNRWCPFPAHRAPANVPRDP